MIKSLGNYERMYQMFVYENDAPPRAESIVMDYDNGIAPRTVVGPYNQTNPYELGYTETFYSPEGYAGIGLFLFFNLTAKVCGNTVHKFIAIPKKSMSGFHTETIPIVGNTQDGIVVGEIMIQVAYSDATKDTNVSSVSMLFYFSKVTINGNSISEIILQSDWYPSIVSYLSVDSVYQLFQPNDSTDDEGSISV